MEDYQLDAYGKGMPLDQTAPKLDLTPDAARPAKEETPLWKAGLVALSQIMLNAKGPNAQAVLGSGAHGGTRQAANPYGGAATGQSGGNRLQTLGKLLRGG